MSYQLIEFLSLGIKERRKKLSELRPFERKKLIEDIPTLTDVLGLDKIEDYEERVRLRYEYICKHPSKVCWDYPELWTRQDRHITLKTALISTEGDGIRWSNDEYAKIRISSSIRPDTIWFRSFYMGEETVRLSRVICSTFLPVPEELKMYQFKNLKVTRKGHVFSDCRLTSLSWSVYMKDAFYDCKKGKGKDEKEER